MEVKSNNFSYLENRLTSCVFHVLVMASASLDLCRFEVWLEHVAMFGLLNCYLIGSCYFSCLSVEMGVLLHYLPLLSITTDTTIVSHSLLTSNYIN